MWEEVQAKINLQLCSLCIKRRHGHQSYAIDDHKAHVESDPAKHKNLSAKFAKDTAENRWGMTIDTLVLTTTLLVANLQVCVKGRKSHDNLRNQLHAGAFGRDPFTAPDLNQIDLHGDRGYFSENSFLGILLPTGCKLICTCLRGLWLAFSTEPVREGDSRIYMPEEGMMTLDVLEKKIKANGQEVTLALTAYRNGHGKAILLASSTHKRLTMDFKRRGVERQRRKRRRRRGQRR